MRTARFYTRRGRCTLSMAAAAFIGERPRRAKAAGSRFASLQKSFKRLACAQRVCVDRRHPVEHGRRLRALPRFPSSSVVRTRRFALKRAGWNGAALRA